jgi:ABC-type transport system involved in multi-copper enzyme maturation permease subunit
MNNGPNKGELSPSRQRTDEPVLARYAGGIGWGLVVVGVVGVIANRTFETPRLLVPSEGWGWMFVLVGLCAAMVHAAVETDQFLRRALGIVGAALVLGGVIWGAWLGTKGKSWAIGLIPTVPGVFLAGLYVRKEEDDAIRHPALLGLGGLGILLAAVGVVGAVFYPQHLGERLSIALVLGFFLTLLHLGIAGVSDEWARRFALGLVGIGAIAIVYALGKSILAAALYEWRSPSEYQHLAAAAAGLSLLILGFVAIYVLGKPPEGGAMTDQLRAMKKWGRIGVLTGGFLLVLAALRYYSPDILTKLGWGEEPARTYLVPTGFTLITAGLAYLAVGVGFLSENRLVVLTRRELTAYFVSPIVYFVMLGFVVIATISYFVFLGEMMMAAEMQQSVEEPIVRRYVIALFPVMAVVLAVPLLTMGLFAEEKRTGTLEVLLTAPVNDWLIVLSKFIASWAFLMLLWMPWWLFLLALRLETGKEFDTRPMFGFTLALGASAAAFCAMGMFFSSLTRNQIVSAALTLMGMLMLLGFYLAEFVLRGAGNLEISVKAVMRALSFIDMWIQAAGGKLYVRDVVVQLSLAVFWIFATVKVLEARRWS